LFILSLVIFYKTYKLSQSIKIIENNNNAIKIERKKLESENKNIQKEIDVKKSSLDAIQASLEKLKETSCKSFEEYTNLLQYQYQQEEKEYDNAIDALRHSYQQLQDKLSAEMGEAREDLEKVRSTRAAAIQAQLKEQEIKDQQSFYCPQVPEDELNDARALRAIEYKLNNPRVLRMLIWQTYYQKPINQVCANILGGATAVKCGIYKITNQIDGMVYIGQTVN
jgi:chromosome segregation ATPase